MTEPIWERINCAYCGEPFDEEQWDLRHDDKGGRDVHEECCQICDEP